MPSPPPDPVLPKCTTATPSRTKSWNGLLTPVERRSERGGTEAPPPALFANSTGQPPGGGTPRGRNTFRCCWVEADPWANRSSGRYVIGVN